MPAIRIPSYQVTVTGLYLAGEYGLGTAARCDHGAGAVGCQHRRTKMIAVDPVNDGVTPCILCCDRKNLIPICTMEVHISKISAMPKIQNISKDA